MSVFLTNREYFFTSFGITRDLNSSNRLRSTININMPVTYRRVETCVAIVTPPTSSFLSSPPQPSKAHINHYLKMRFTTAIVTFSLFVIASALPMVCCIWVVNFL